MTTGSLADAAAARSGVGWDALGDGLLAVTRFFRPRDGWLSLVLLALNLMVVIWSVEGADWVPTPNLAGLILLAMLTGLLLSRVPVWGILMLPVGFAIGALVIFWQLTSFQAEGMEFANTGELVERLNLWLAAAKTGSINIDRAPFAFGLMVVTWTSGFLAGWVFFRYGNFWGVFILGGAGLVSNLTYLPESASRDLGIYLLTALLLVARVQSVRRRRGWEARNIRYDGHLGLLSICDSFLIAIAVLVVAFLVLPVGKSWGPTHETYEYMRSPLVRWEDDFNRLFAGLPARRPLPYRIWGDVMAFQGTINPATTVVLQVNSPVPMYWRARTYGTYTPKGWGSLDTVLKPTDWTPTYSVPQPYLKRFEVNHAVTPNYNSRNLFVGGQILGLDREVRVETYDSPTYTLDLGAPDSGGDLHPQLKVASLSLGQALKGPGAVVSDASLARSLPPEFHLVDVEREQGEIQRVRIAEVIAQHPDTLSVRTDRGSVKSGETYQITSSVSLAESQDLRLAVLDYPTWALDKYTQLPSDFPQSIRDLARDVTAGAPNSYDKAKAVEEYLKNNFEYNLRIEPPPYNADGVEHFLFTQKEGYSEYFASAMTVMLRSEGMPARLVTGYSLGEKLPDQEVYMVTDKHSHAWVEVFFPRYGWILFEPTPGREIPKAVRPTPSLGQDGLTGPGLRSQYSLCDDYDEEDCEDERDAKANAAADSAENTSFWARQLVPRLPWLVAILATAVVGAVASWIFWKRIMTPSPDPQITFRRLAFLGGLSSIGPADYQTPYQYRSRLDQEFPGQQENLEVIFDHYVGSLYGKKGLADEEERQLVRAWTGIRLPMLLNLFRRRSI